MEFGASNRGSKSRVATQEEFHARLMQGQNADNLPLWEWNELRNELTRERRDMVLTQRQLEVAELSARPRLKERLHQAEERVSILHKAWAACQAEGNLRPAAMAVVIAERIEFLTRELEDVENQIAVMRGWMAELPEGAAQARELAQKDVDYKVERVRGMKDAREWELEWSIKVSTMSDSQVALNASQGGGEHRS